MLLWGIYLKTLRYREQVGGRQRWGDRWARWVKVVKGTNFNDKSVLGT